MIVNPDHMSQAGVDRTLSLLEARNYSGVISPTAGWTPATGRGSGSSAGWRSRGTPRQTATSASGRSTGREHAVPVRLGLRRRPGRSLRAAGDRRGRRRDHLSVQGPRRRGDLRSPEDRRADVRLQLRRRRPVRPLRRLVRRPAPDRRRRAGQGHAQRLRGLPGDVGARGGDRDARLRVRPTARSPRPARGAAARAVVGRAAEGRRPAPAARPRVELLRLRRRQRGPRRRGRADARRRRRAGRLAPRTAAARAAWRSARRRARSSTRPPRARPSAPSPRRTAPGPTR